MRQILSVSACCFVMLLALAALGALHVLPRGLATVVIPDRWSVRDDGELELVALSPDEKVTLVLADQRVENSEPPVEPPPPRPFGHVEDFVAEGRPERLKFHGFEGFIRHGKGRVGDEAVAADRIVLFHRLRHFMVSGWAYGREKAYDAARKREITRIVRSLRAVE